MPWYIENHKTVLTIEKNPNYFLLVSFHTACDSKHFSPSSKHQSLLNSKLLPTPKLVWTNHKLCSAGRRPWRGVNPTKKGINKRKFEFRNKYVCHVIIVQAKRELLNLFDHGVPVQK